MARKTTTARTTYRVTCPNYTQTRASLPAAQRNADEMNHPDSACREWHTVEVNDGTGWVPLHVHRARQILALPCGPDPVDTPDGPLIKMQAGWSTETSTRPAVLAARASGDVEAYRRALGPHEYCTLTEDGRPAGVHGWCRCAPEPQADAWVRYERWDGSGRVAHGFVCPSCRRLVQSG